MIQLQERDFEILKLCYEQRAVTTEHIQSFVLQGVCERVARRRLQRLEQARLIHRKQLVQVGSKRIIRLASEGYKLAAATSPISIPKSRKLDLNTLAHDVCVTSVRLRLEAIWDGHWLSETAMKSEEFNPIPDGLWIFQTGSRVAIEVERTTKGHQRFHQLQARWRESDVALILYVAVGELMYRHVKRYIESGPTDLPFGLVEYGSLLSGTPLVWTRASEIELLNRRSF